MFLFVFFAFSMFFFASSVFSDAPEPWQLGFQDPASPVMQGIVDFHHDVFCFLLFILGFVMWMLGRTLWLFRANEAGAESQPAKIVHHSVIEIV